MELSDQIDRQELKMNKEDIIKKLKEVYDPEMPTINVYDLGLIYNIEINELNVKITFTLTSMACPFADYIVQEIHDAVKCAGANEVDMCLVFEPPFTMDSVPEETRMMMGWDFDPLPGPWDLDHG